MGPPIRRRRGRGHCEGTISHPSFEHNIEFHFRELEHVVDDVRCWFEHHELRRTANPAEAPVEGQSEPQIGKLKSQSPDSDPAILHATEYTVRQVTIKLDNLLLYCTSF